VNIAELAGAAAAVLIIIPFALPARGRQSRQAFLQQRA
jgi:hypothetical protein